MQPIDPVLFACYILFVYFNGQNITRIEREMRALGYTQFHRRILYPRGTKPGWIGKFGWQLAVGGVQSPKSSGNAGSLPGNAGALACMSAKHESNDKQPIARHSTPPQIPPTANSQPPTDFPAWLRTVSPNMAWSWRHQQVIMEQLQRVTDGDCRRLMIFLPPRHGKSELVTVRYTAWRMQRDTSMNVILGSYNQRLADRFSRKIRKVISDAESLSEPALVRAGLPKATAGHETSKLGAPNSTHRSPEGRLASSSCNPQCSSHQAEPPASAGGTARKNRNVNTYPSGQTPEAQAPSHAGGSAFPFISSKPANSVSEWETTTGGGFRSVGVGSGVTGFGASLIVIDDPIKSRAEAESEAYRERVWDWFTDDLYTRLEPDGAIVLIQTRWHEDDLAGRLLRESAEEGGEQWTVVNLPAIAEHDPPRDDTQDTPLEAESSQLAAVEKPSSEPADSCQPSASSQTHDWRIPGEPLCPERYDKQALSRIRRRLGEYSFAALYQQRPTPAEGGLFKREWFKRIIPFAPLGLKWKRGYDLAVSTKTNADYTASFRCAFDKEGNLYISGGFRARLEYPDQRRFIIERVKAETDTEHGIELALHGQALIQDLRRERGIRGHLLRGVKVEHDKYTRALTWAPLPEEGKVILVRNSSIVGRRQLAGGSQPRNAPPDSSSNSPTADGQPPTANSYRPTANWINDFLDEVCSFPSAAHDDQVDAVSLAVQMLKGSGKRSWGF